MKKKFRITENQAQKILKLNEQWPQPCAEYAAQLGGVNNANAACCEKCLAGSVTSPSDPCYNYCERNCCDDDTNQKDSFRCLDDGSCVSCNGPGCPYPTLAACEKECGPTGLGDDPCKDKPNEDCFWCHPEMGTSCVPVGGNLTYAQNNGFNLYQDPAVCAANEPDCGGEEPCPPPAQGCPPGTTWNPVTCHCEGTTIGDDPCEVNPKDCWFCKSPGSPCMQFSQTTLAFTNSYLGTKYPTKPDCENNSECKPIGRDDGGGCPDIICENPNHVQGPYPGCKCECPEGSGEKGCKKGTSWSPDECCCVDKKGICVPDNTSPTNPVDVDFVGPLYTENKTKLSEEINRIKKLLK